MAVNIKSFLRKHWLRLVLVVAVLVPLIAAYLGFAAETGRCWSTGTVLSAEELRIRAIRSLLMVYADIPRWKRKRIRSSLIPRSLSNDDVIDLVRTKAIVNLEKETVYPVNTEREINSVPDEFLRGEFSLLLYSHILGITPSSGIDAVSVEAARSYLDPNPKHSKRLSLTERARGYGNHYFHKESYVIRRYCCEEPDSPDKAVRAERYSQEVINAIERGKYVYADIGGTLSRSRLVVSNCGDVLQRPRDEQTGPQKSFHLKDYSVFKGD